MKSQLHTLIVGGTKGLGRAIAAHIASTGHRVSIISRNPSAKNVSKNILWSHADIAEHKSVRAALQEIAHANGPLDNIVLTQRFRGTDDVWAGEIDATITGTRNVIEVGADFFKKNGTKSIVVVGSVAGRAIVDDQPASYHMAKAAQDQLVRYYAVTLGKEQIRVNGITPCAFVKEESRKHYGQKQFQDFYRKMAPLGRMVTASDLSALVEFLTSPSCFLTGQIITIDGGISLLWPEAAARRVR